MERFYTSITKETLTGARDRALDDLNALTDGKADVAIKYVSEFLELDSILEEYTKEEKEREEREERKIL